jgi:hypothetical protein
MVGSQVGKVKLATGVSREIRKRKGPLSRVLSFSSGKSGADAFIGG